MLIRNKVFFRKKGKTTAFWQKNTAKTRDSRHLTKITVSVISVFPWLTTANDQPVSTGVCTGIGTWPWPFVDG